MSESVWMKYWNSQDTPRHVSEESEFYRMLADELHFYLGNCTGKSILELGCGNGALFDERLDKAGSYTGVDFSASLLGSFQYHSDHVSLITSDVIEFLKATQDKYDIIFSNSLVQYLQPQELRKLFELQCDRIKSGGKAVHLAIPCTELARPFFKGFGTSAGLANGSRSLLKNLKSRAYNKIGNWYSMKELYDISQESGYSTMVTSNIHYFYRVNIIQTVKD